MKRAILHPQLTICSQDVIIQIDIRQKRRLDFSSLPKECINNFCSESSQAYRQDELSLHCAYTFSLNTTSSGSAQSAVSGGWNVNDTQKTASAFENGDGLFVGKQFLCDSLQLAQVAVDGGLRGAQLGGHLADGTLHIKDARVV